MLDHAADEIEAELREIGILVAGHLRLAVLPDREVAMHARAVVAEDRLRHEAGRLAIGMRHIVDHILVDLHLVGHGDERVVLHAELVLGGGHFVMVLFDGDAHLGHDGEHFGAHVLRRVLRIDREIAALGAHPVAEIAGLVFGVGVGRQFDRVDLEAGIVGRRREAHVVEDEELGFRARHRSCRRPWSA